MSQLTLVTENIRFVPMPCGAVTWRRGERCVVLEYLPDTYAEPMYAVAFSNGRIGIHKPSELGLKASEVAAYLAKQKAA